MRNVYRSGNPRSTLLDPLTFLQPQNGELCSECWSVICTEPWPQSEGEHADQRDLVNRGKQHDARVQEQTGAGAYLASRRAQFRPHLAEESSYKSMETSQRRSYSMVNIASMAGSHVQAVSPRLPNSMPEQAAVLASSAEDPRWNALAVPHPQSGSLPVKRGSLKQSAPPPFSPQELRNLMDEESLELFESQSHLLDPESRALLMRQRQYLEWQSSLDREPGLLRSTQLERQDSAGSGCAIGEEDDLGGTRGAKGVECMEASYGVHPSSAPHVSVDHHHRNERKKEQGSIRILHELQEAQRLLAVVRREREALSNRVDQLEAELEAQRELNLCKYCRQVI